MTMLGEGCGLVGTRNMGLVDSERIQTIRRGVFRNIYGFVEVKNCRFRPEDGGDSERPQQERSI